MKTIVDFDPGCIVRYVPMHASGDQEHRDCEVGVVSSRNERVVFVKYFRPTVGTNLLLKQTAQATAPEDLTRLWPQGD